MPDSQIIIVLESAISATISKLAFPEGTANQPQGTKQQTPNGGFTDAEAFF